MREGPVNSYSLKWSCALHGVLLFSAIVLPLLPVFRSKEKEIPAVFTVVLDENLIEPNVPKQAEPAQKPAPATKQAEPEPEEAEPEPDAPPPAPLPEPPKDALVIEKKKPQPEKPKPPVKKPEKPVEKKVEKLIDKKPFVKGKRIEVPTKPAKPAQPKFDEMYKPFDPSKPVSTKPLTDKMLSRGEIEKALGMGARAGTQNSIPDDEVSRCVILVRRAMYEAWDQPGAGDAGTRPALLDIRLDSTGRIVNYQIRQSSGSSLFDQTVLKAAANMAPIRGLSLAFLKQYETLTVEFKLE